MGKCATCGNEYDKTFTVSMGDRSDTFDSFECAISALAPLCKLCGIRIIGHGVEAAGQMYCCAHCAHQDGVEAARDRVSA